MYIPKHFQEPDRKILFDLIDHYGFATLLSWNSAEPMISHIPLLLDRNKPGEERLLGHVSRSNSHWQRFEGKELALAIFQGPHAYVSPSWYPTTPAVPTWSYTVVHVYGKPRCVDSRGTWEIVRRLIEKYERGRTNPWPGTLPEDFVEDELQYIVGFEFPIERIEGKFKLGQNRAAADRAGAFEGLAHEPHPGSQALAAFALAYFDRRKRS